MVVLEWLLANQPAVALLAASVAYLGGCMYTATYFGKLSGRENWRGLDSFLVLFSCWLCFFTAYQISLKVITNVYFE